MSIKDVGTQIKCVDMRACVGCIWMWVPKRVYFMLQGGSAYPDSLNGSNSSGIEPLPGLETILEELLREDGYVSISV